MCMDLENIMLSEISQTEKDKYCISLMYEKRKNELIETENRFVVARGEGRELQMGKGSQEVQTSSYKIKKSWGCNAQHGDYS